MMTRLRDYLPLVKSTDNPKKEVMQPETTGAKSRRLKCLPTSSRRQSATTFRTQADNWLVMSIRGMRLSFTWEWDWACRNEFKHLLWLGRVTWLTCAEYKRNYTWLVCTYIARKDALQRKSHLCLPIEGIARPQSQFPHSCLRAIYIFLESVHIFSCSRIGRPILRIYKSLTDTWIWKLGLTPRNSFSGNICFEFSVLCLCSVLYSYVGLYSV